MVRAGLLAILALAAGQPAGAQARLYSRSDTLRGSPTTPGRSWWDVVFYDLRVRISPADSSIRGSNAISYRVLEPGSEMQIDLMSPLEMDSVVQGGRTLALRREGHAYLVRPEPSLPGRVPEPVVAYYHGKPRVAARPPWEGGFTWGTDSLHRPWVVTSDQGVGASIWWPNKDTQADEPDSMRIAITVPEPMVNVSNGRLRRTTRHRDGTVTYEWFVSQPINNYAVAINAGSYGHYRDTFSGEGGTLTLDFYPLSYHLDAARKQWAQVKPMLACFEHWFGPYPWYEDGYKLIETSHLGMEHQSAIGYGNGFQNGYRGRDLSTSGHGLQWDFIIVHESAHEWWGNNITTRDIADMWVHEGFANYAEGLYTECLLGKPAGAEYTVGSRYNAEGQRPIVTDYGVNATPPIDQYYKAGNLLHLIRQLLGDDEKWRAILRGLNATFRHQTVTGRQVEDYLSTESGLDLGKVFDQYLRTTQIPVFNYRIARDTLSYRWQSTVPGFEMPIRVTVGPNEWAVLRPTARWQRMPIRVPAGQFRVDPNWFVAVMPEP